MKRRQTTANDVEKAYEYTPLGKYVVSAPAVCRGRPTFKGTRVEVAGVLEWLAAGHSIDELIANHCGRISRAAIKEAATLAGKALAKHVQAPRSRQRS